MWWMEKLINALMTQGQWHGAAFSEEHVKLAVSMEYKVFLVKYLKEVYVAHPGTIAIDVDVVE